jgi:hypothetical protein
MAFMDGYGGWRFRGLHGHAQRDNRTRCIYEGLRKKVAEIDKISLYLMRAWIIDGSHKED